MQQLNAEMEETLFKEQIESRKLYCFIKRVMDILGSAMGLVILSPILLVIGIIVKIESKGPLVFAQERV
ncbi:sugar transferase, partial [Clostridium saccharobutylicum]